MTEPTEAQIAAANPKKKRAAEPKRDKFVRVLNIRMKNALKAIDLVGEMAGKPYYEYAQQDADIITRKLEKAIEKVTKQFTPPEEPDPRQFNLLDELGTKEKAA